MNNVDDELQRWLPLEGFSGRLLPTDRYNFSNQDGTIDRSRDKVKLPSMAWQWEGDWQIETTLDGQPLDHDVHIFSFVSICASTHYTFTFFIQYFILKLYMSNMCQNKHACNYALFLKCKSSFEWNCE